MRRHKIALIPGDGIGSDVINAGRRVLDALAAADGGFEFAFETFDWGSDRYRRVGKMMPDEGVDTLRAFDAIYFGAVGDPKIPDHITLWELRLAICQGLDQYANVRPSRLLPNVVGPLRPELGREIDWVIVRENSEGEYAGAGGRVHRGLPIEVGLDVSVFTRSGIERVARFACELAASRPRKHLIIVTKSNAQRHGMVLWDEVCKEVIRDFPDLSVDWMLVDAMTMRMVLRPGTVDTVLATNLHADVLSDLASALSGSLGVGATGNLAPDRKTPSMFEPIHGSGFDLIGLGIANPIGAFWSAALMLEHLHETEAAAELMSAIERLTAEGITLPPDLGGTARTDDVTDAVIGILRRQNDAAIQTSRGAA